MEFTSAIRKARRIPRQGNGQRNHKETKNKARPPQPHGNGFLKHRFIPMVSGNREELNDWRKVSQTFFRSLNHLCDLYRLVTPEVGARVYPDNIRYAYHMAAAQMNALRPDLQLIILQERDGGVQLATVKPFDTGMTLYYIPVRPLWKLCSHRENRLLANLLLSVYAYLYQVASVPYYTENSSYLCGTYEMLEEWIAQDPDNFDAEDYAARMDNINALKWCGRKMLKRMQHPYQLQQFTVRIAAFTASGEAEEQLLQVCKGLHRLYTDYPERSVFDNIREGWLDPMEEERIYPEQYLSFYWDGDDYLNQALIETVNCDLQEKSVSDEPLAVQLFFERQHHTTCHELDFEKRLFDLINDLTALL